VRRGPPSSWRPADTGRVRSCRARVHGRLGRDDEAHTYLLRALDLYREVGDIASPAAARDSLGSARHALRQTPQAVDCYEQALTHCRRLGNRCHQADTLIDPAETHEASGDRDAALTQWKPALRILDDLQHTEPPRSAPASDSDTATPCPPFGPRTTPTPTEARPVRTAYNGARADMNLSADPLTAIRPLPAPARPWGRGGWVRTW